jgi:hypothetical protein
MPAPSPLRLAAAALFLATAGAGTASAATVSTAPDPGPGGGELATYVAAPGEANDLSVSQVDDYTLRVTDLGAVIVAGDNCTSIDAHAADCSSPMEQHRRYLYAIAVAAGDGDDRVESAGDHGPGLRVADGGPGDDELLGSLDKGDVLDGGGGHDTLRGRGNSDTLADGDTSGAADADVLDGGGDNLDTVSYANRTAPVYVDLSNPLADGEQGEGDTLVGIRAVIGGSGDDRLAGTGGHNRLEGKDGDDRVEGRGGSDDLYGGDGRDTVLGRLGDDFLTGGSGRDKLFGAQGNDALNPKSGGDDLDCGRAFDTALLPHAADFLEPGCDRVTYGRGGNQFSASAYPTEQRRSSVDFELGCPRPEILDGLSRPVSGTLRVRESGGRERTLGKGTITKRYGKRCGGEPVPSGLTVTVDLTTLGRRLGSRHKGVRSTVSLRGRGFPDADWTIELHSR